MTGSSPAGTPPTGADAPEREYGLRFWLGLAVGWAFIGFGIHSAFHTQAASRPGYSVSLLIGFALLNDLFVVPVVVVAGLALRRVVRGGIVSRTALGALIVSAIVCLQAWPALGGYGREPSLATSLLTNNIVSGLLTVVGVVWGVAALVVVARLGLARRSQATARRAQPTARSAPGPVVVGNDGPGIRSAGPPAAGRGRRSRHRGRRR